VLFQCLPVSAHVIGDAISEATFFLFLTTSLLLAAQALRGRSNLGLALCGVCAGLAYLTRPEGALVVIAVLFVLAYIQRLRASRWPWRTAFAGATALLLGALAVGGPYAATIGHLTAKPTPQKMTIEGKQSLERSEGQTEPLPVARTGTRTLCAAV